MKDKLIREYSFEIEDAIAFGVDEAIMLKNIKFWLAKNEANNANFFDGKYWTFNSANAYSQLFPFWTQKQINRIINSLTKKGVLLVGNYNKIPYDRTRWYTIEFSKLPNKNFDLPKWENGNDEIGTPIPDINTNDKPDINTDNTGSFLSFYRQLCTNLPQVRELSLSRRNKIKARLKDAPIETWREVFEKMNASKFCCGENDRKWTASFDWIIANDNNYVKVLEGKYDDKQKEQIRWDY